MELKNQKNKLKDSPKIKLYQNKLKPRSIYWEKIEIRQESFN